MDCTFASFLGDVGNSPCDFNVHLGIYSLCIVRIAHTWIGKDFTETRQGKKSFVVCERLIVIGFTDKLKRERHDQEEP